MDGGSGRRTGQKPGKQRNTFQSNRIQLEPASLVLVTSLNFKRRRIARLGRESREREKISSEQKAASSAREVCRLNDAFERGQRSRSTQFLFK